MQYSERSSVLDPTSNQWIPFETPSDALLAELHLVHDVPSSAIDLVLQMVMNPLFDRTQITLKSPADIARRVSEYRWEVALRRSARSHTTAGIHPFILDIVLKSIANEIMSIHDEMDIATDPYCSVPSDDREPRRVIETMSRVHRSWTAPAQTTLRRRVFIANRTSLAHFLKHPFCGPWIRELGCLQTSDGPILQWRDLADLLSRTPNARVLHVRNVSCSTALPSFFQSLGGMDLLQRLSIGGSGADGHAFLAQLCAMLPSMRSLAFLRFTMENTLVNDQGYLPPSESPPPSLKTVCLTASSMDGSSPHLSWLFRANGDFALENIVLIHGPETVRARFRPLTAVTPALATLRTLYVDLQARWIFSQFDAGEDLELVGTDLASVTALRTLHLCGLPLSADIRLPESLEEIRCYATRDNWGRRENRDRRIHGLLTARPLPRLRRFGLVYHEGGGFPPRSDAERAARFPLTVAFCEQEGVELTCHEQVDEDNYLASLGIEY